MYHYTQLVMTLKRYHEGVSSLQCIQFCVLIVVMVTRMTTYVIKFRRIMQVFLCSLNNYKLVKSKYEFT